MKTSKALETLAGKTWNQDHPDEPCPPEKVPTEADLATWVWSESIQQEADKRLQALFPDAEKVAWKQPRGEEILIAHVVTRWETSHAKILCSAHYELDYVLDQWQKGQKHPLAPIVRGWQNRPVEVRPTKRQDPIFPVIAPEREMAELAFGGLFEDRQPPQLVLFSSLEGPRVPLLEMTDAAGVQVMAQGRGAPLDLRLAVGSALLSPHEARGETLRLVISTKDLRNFLYPNSRHFTQHWPGIRKSLFRLRDYRIPTENGWWYPFALRQEPGDRARLTDDVILEIALPPGSADGPPVDRATVSQLGVRSGGQYCAYLAVHSIAWRPGKTRVPIPRSSQRSWTGDPDKYEIVTAEDRKRLAFGAHDRKNRTRDEVDTAWRNLPGVVLLDETARDPQTGREGWLILPEAAAEKVHNRGKKVHNRGKKVHNRGKKSS